MSQFGNRSSTSSSNLSYKRGIFDGSRQQSLAERKYLKVQGKEFSFTQATYKISLFLDLDPNPHLLHCLIKNTGWCFTTYVLCIPILYCIHRHASQAKQMMILIEWELIVEIDGQKQQSNLLKQDNRSFLVMSKYIYIPGLIENMDWVYLVIFLQVGGL